MFKERESMYSDQNLQCLFFLTFIVYMLQKKTPGLFLGLTLPDFRLTWTCGLSEAQIHGDWNGPNQDHSPSTIRLATSSTYL